MTKNEANNLAAATTGSATFATAPATSPKPNQVLPPTLHNMPVEIHRQIFKCLDPVTSTCLGLACKAFYGIHWERHEKIPLTETYRSYWWRGRWLLVQLADLLKEWGGPTIWVYDEQSEAYPDPTLQFRR